MGVIEADHLLLHLPKSYEIELILIDCVAPSRSFASDTPGVYRTINLAATQAVDRARELIESATELHAWIPQPRADLGWVKSIQPRSRHAGYLYLSSDRTLNDELITAGHCRRPARSAA